MKLSYNLLKSWLNFKETPEELAALIDLHITEVEELIATAQYPGVVVGKILEITPHPNADRLRLTVVDVGTEKLRIVCGGQNIAVGQKIPVATIGAILPNGMTIVPATIRGEESFGMLCSEAELGLPVTIDGVMILDSKVKVGQSLDEALGNDSDYTIDIKVLSNRPDYTSYFSIAREIAAVLNTPFTPPIELDYPVAKFKTKDYLKVSIKDKTACQRYLARVVRNVQVKPSPEWMQKILKASGLRPINNLVDISNYVMLESGHPIHIFDYNKLAGTEIVVRFAHAGEQLFCLDGVTRKLTADTAVIADANQPVAVAGIIGGSGSSVSDDTVDIAIEVANFDRVNIRNSARRFGLRTDASARFERGVDLLDGENVMARILNLIHADLPEADIFDKDLDIHDKLPAVSRILKVAIIDINKLAGIEIPPVEMARILTSLNLPTEVGDTELTVSVPYYRQDIVGVPDIVEEVVRLYGTDKIVDELPVYTPMPLPTPKMFILGVFLKEKLAQSGLVEVQTHAFTTEAKNAVKIANPLNENWTHLKTDLLPQLLALPIDENGEKAIFEVNNVFTVSKEVLPHETKQLAVVCKGKNAYRRARGLLDLILKQINISASFNETPDGNGLIISRNKVAVGRLVAEGEKNAGFTLGLSNLVEDADFTSIYTESPKFPPTKMDMAFKIEPATRVGAMIEAIRKVSPLLTSIELFDDFMMAEGKRSVAFHIELRSPEGTLTNVIRDELAGKVVDALKQSFKATLRE